MSQEVTLYLIRHAQAEDDGTKNPHLSELGKVQANYWAKAFIGIELDEIYSTDYHRTQETAAPTAKSKKIKVQSYDPSSFDINELVNKSDGKNLLIVGHSNTTPENVNALLGDQSFEHIDHKQHGYQFIVQIKNGEASVKKLKIFK